MYLKPSTAEEVMHYRLPVMVEDLSKNQWFNWGPPPPGEETAGIAVAYNKFGKGQAVYAGVPLFRAMSTRTDFGNVVDRPYWIRNWIHQLVRQLIPNPFAEIVPMPFTEYLHGSFFYEKSRRFILVQVLNTVELLAKGELQAPIGAEILINSNKLKVTGARVVWPETEDLAIRAEAGRTIVVLPRVERYMALYLRLT